MEMDRQRQERESAGEYDAGSALRPACRGQGHAREALTALLAFACMTSDTPEAPVRLGPWPRRLNMRPGGNSLIGKFFLPGKLFTGRKEKTF
jgi:hypothetical protein